MGGVFHETFVSFIFFELYKFKNSNLLCWKKESLVMRNSCFVIHVDAVFQETFVSFITFEVYMFKDSNLLCWKGVVKTASDVHV